MILFLLCPVSSVNGAGAIAWQPFVIDYEGPYASESDSQPENPFLDFRFQVIFVGPGGQVYDVPGFFAGDGKGKGQGNIWRVIFTPDQAGTWSYAVYHENGANIAVGLTVGGSISEGTTWSAENGPYVVSSSITVTDNATLTISDDVKVYFAEGVKLNTSGSGKIVTAGSNIQMIPMTPKARGSFSVAERDSSAPGFLSKGRLVNLVNDGSYYLKCAGDNTHWIKGGTDSPENFLAYSGFDDTTPSHDFKPDNGIYDDIYGAVDYLYSKNVNSIYLLLMNIGGDGKDVYPYLHDKIDPAGSPDNDNLHFDISKLYQWDEFFRYCQEKGIHLHFVLGEGEALNKQELDNATLGIERKLYYREMIARFGYHNAVTWNLCEEYDYPALPISSDMIKSWAQYIKDLDPYDHPVTVHNFENSLDGGWNDFWGDRRFGVVSQQFLPDDLNSDDDYLEEYVDKVTHVRQKTADNGWKIPVGLDETHRATAELDNVCDEYSCGPEGMRKNVIYPVYYSGGQLELILKEYLEVEDFSEYEHFWDYMWYARKSLDGMDVSSMEPRHEDVTYGQSGNELCFTNGHDYAVYLPNGGSCQLNLAEGNFTMQFYNPRTGQNYGNAISKQGGGNIPINSPSESDWVVLLVKN